MGNLLLLLFWCFKFALNVAMVSLSTIYCAGEILGSAERIVADEHLLANWNSLGGNKTTTLSEQRQGHFPSWSPLGGNVFMRHDASPGPSRGK